MTRTFEEPIRASMLLAATCAGLLVGCKNSGPSGDTGGRVDPYNTKGREESDPGMNMAAMLEASDRVAMAIADRIGGTMAEHANKVVIEIGVIDNRTRTPWNDFVLIRRRVVGKLVNSDIVGQVAKINEAPEVMDDQAKRFAPPKPVDRLDENLAPAAPATERFAAADTYLLNGNFSEATRGGASLYYLEMSLTNLQSRQIVFTEQFDFKQVR